MHVSVRLHASLVSHAPGARAGETFQVAIPAESRVRDLIGRLGVPEDQVRNAFVNGRARGPDWQLEPGDEIGIFPAVGGG
jgi:molybdopterin converting factor small subunit